jgi:Fe2+ or Zn2+ uptake regulation protein
LHEVEGLSEGGNRYDKELQPHHHLYCQRCQKLIDINLDDASVMVPDYPALGFKVKRTQVTFYGICSECQTLTVNDDDEYQKRG